jgi:4-hydroxy-L-threonine phosphate dehydrogenase PdxA
VLPKPGTSSAQCAKSVIQEASFPHPSQRALIADFGIAAPPLAIAGLNPHAGETGRMGSKKP